MEFLCRQTFACRENVSVWTGRQTDKIGNDILETLVNVTVCTQSKVSADKVCYYKYKEVNCSKPVGKKPARTDIIFSFYLMNIFGIFGGH
jgi:hypothetical protein